MVCLLPEHHAPSPTFPALHFTNSQHPKQAPTATTTLNPSTLNHACSWFPNGGYYGCLGAGAADGRGCRHISTAEFLAKAGLGGGGGDGSGSGSGNSTSTASGGGGGGGGGLAPSAQYGK